MNYLYWGLGGLAAFFGIRWLAGRNAPTDADAAQQQASQPSLPMFVSGAFGGGFGGGGFGGGGFGGGSGVMPALPASEFPAIPSSTINFPEMPGTNENDVMIADYNFRTKLAAFKYEENLAKWTFDILKFGVDNPATTGPNPAGVLVGGQVIPIDQFNKDDYRRVTPPGSGRTGGVIRQSGSAGPIIERSITAELKARDERIRKDGLSASSVQTLFNTMSSSQAEMELYRRAQSAGASNKQIANLLNQSGISDKSFSAIDVENWKTQRGL